MKTPTSLLFLTLFIALIFSRQQANAQNTAFTYQGRLNSGSGPANGLYDLRFRLAYDPFGNNYANGGTPFLAAGTVVSNGLFTVPIDFGTAVFNGSNLWLEIGITTNGGGAFTTLNPLQPLTPTPYAITASNITGTIPSAQLTGTYSGQLTLNNAANVIAGTFSGNGAGVTNVNAAGLTGTIPNSLLSGFQSPYNTVGGGQANAAGPTYATVAGGLSNVVNSATSFVGGGFQNVIQPGNAANITGGYQNQIQANSYEGTIGGGWTNTIGPDSPQATIGGGEANRAFGWAATVAGGIGNLASNQFAAIGGGNNNVASGDTSVIAGGVSNVASNTLAVIGGGAGNVASGGLTVIGGGQGNYAIANNSTVGGGLFNTNISVLGFVGGGYYNYAAGIASTIAGGMSNRAFGSYSFAGGLQAQAWNDGSFVWADTQGGYFGSTTNDEFNIRSFNGVRIQTDRGIHLSAGDRPLIVRDWDVFGTNAPTWKAGIGRWGLFMEPYNLVAGIPAEDAGTRGFEVGKYSTNGNYQSLLRIDQNGYLYNSNNLVFHTFGTNNVFVGVNAGNLNGTGYDNVSVGYGALQQTTTGSGNTAVGTFALTTNTAGYDNTAFGYFSLKANTNGLFNTAVGASALTKNTSGYDNTAIGVSALANNTTGSNNIAIGFLAGSLESVGSSNIFIGSQGGYDNRTTRIGTQGTQTNCFVAGIYGATAASGVAVYCNSSGQLGTLTSSAKYKKDIKQMQDASEALYSLQPVTFKYKDELDPNGTPQFGLIAEQVEKVDPSLVAHDENGKIYTVRYQAVDAMLLNEFLKEHRKVQDQERKALEQEQKLTKQEAEIDALKQQLQQIQQLMDKIAR